MPEKEWWQEYHLTIEGWVYGDDGQGDHPGSAGPMVSSVEVWLWRGSQPDPARKEPGEATRMWVLDHVPQTTLDTLHLEHPAPWKGC